VRIVVDNRKTVDIRRGVSFQATGICRRRICGKTEDDYPSANLVVTRKFCDQIADALRAFPTMIGWGVLLTSGAFLYWRTGTEER